MGLMWKTDMINRENSERSESYCQVLEPVEAVVSAVGTCEGVGVHWRIKSLPAPTTQLAFSVS